MKRIILSFAVLLIGTAALMAQNVGIGTITPDASALLELKTTTKGFLPPRMLAAEKKLIPSPKPGLMIYQTDGTKGLYVYDGTNWIEVTTPSVTPVSAWLLTGNTGTNPATDFVGTTDNVPLKFKVNNITSGGIYPANGNVAIGMFALDSALSNGSENTAIGSNALHSTTYGDNNNALGSGALYKNKTGEGNVALGSNALLNNTSANNNIAIGTNTLYQNSIGYNNLGIGNKALYSNVDGDNNIAIGDDASHFNVSGSNIIAIGDSALHNNTMSYNVAIGSKALFYNSNGFSNTAIGSQVLYNNTVGNQNTGVGRASLLKNFSGNQNTALGYQSLKNNETGNRNVALGFQSLYFNDVGSNNTAIGSGSLVNTIANDNTAVGSDALNKNTSGYLSTAIGKGALINNTTGFSNTAIGYNTLLNNQSGSKNTAVGAEAAIYKNNYVNGTAIGANAIANCSNCMVLGSVPGLNGGTANIYVGIGANTPQTDLHVNPNGAGSILIGTNKISGGYTNLEMGITSQYDGKGYIQSTNVSGTSSGDMHLNPNGGYVGINLPTATTAFAPLDIKQSLTNRGLRLRNNYNSSGWDIASDGTLNFYANGLYVLQIGMDGSYNQISDQRLKTNVVKMETVLDKVMALKPSKYQYINNNPTHKISTGFLAQEIMPLFPELISDFKHPTSDTTDNNVYHTINYTGFSVIAIKAIQEQQQQLYVLKNENIMLKEKTEKLEAAIEAIEQKMKK